MFGKRCGTGAGRIRNRQRDSSVGSIRPFHFRVSGQRLHDIHDAGLYQVVATCTGALVAFEHFGQD